MRQFTPGSHLRNCVCVCSPKAPKMPKHVFGDAWLAHRRKCSSSHREPHEELRSPRGLKETPQRLSPQIYPARMTPPPSCEDVFAPQDFKAAVCAERWIPFLVEAVF